VKRDAEPKLRRSGSGASSCTAGTARPSASCCSRSRRAGPPSAVIVKRTFYIINWLPFGAGQLQDGDTTKGVIIATSP